MKEEIVYKNKFDEYLTCFGLFVFLFFSIFLFYKTGFFWFIVISLIIDYFGFGIEYLKIYLYKDVLIIKRPLRLSRRITEVSNLDIIKVIYELPKGSRNSPKIIIQTDLKKKKIKFNFMNSGREIHHFLKALEGLGIVVDYPTPD